MVILPVKRWKPENRQFTLGYQVVEKSSALEKTFQINEKPAFWPLYHRSRCFFRRGLRPAQEAALVKIYIAW
jgi:hypothetical protein